MANKKISELESRASLSLSDLMAVGDPSTGYLYKTTISDLKTLTGAGVVSFNGRFGTVNPAEGDYTLTQLGDVIITSPTNGQVLKFNGSNWVNASDVVEADTLATVTARGNVTTGDIAVNGKITIGTAFPGTGQRIEANAGAGNFDFVNSSGGGFYYRWIQNGATAMQLSTANNLLIGTVTDAGYKVDINGTLRVQSRIVTGLGGIANNCLYTYIGNHCGSSGFLGFGFVNTGDPGLGDSVFDIYQSPSAAPSYPLFNFKHIAADSTGNANALNIVAVTTTVNQTNGSNGVVRGFYYNPTLTSINGSHFAFESTSGKIKVSDLAGTGSRMVVADANGVLSTQAIPSLTGFVPYTGATANLNLGAFDLLSRALFVEGTASYNSGIALKQSNGVNYVSGSYTQIVPSLSNELFFIFNQSGSNRKMFTFSVGLLQNNDNFQYQLPRASGTIALTSDIPSVAGVYLPLAGGTLTGGLTISPASGVASMTMNAPTGQLNEILFKVNNVNAGWMYVNSSFFQFNSSTSGGYLFKNTAGTNILAMTDAGAATFNSSVTATQYVATGGNNLRVLTTTGATTGWQYADFVNTSGRIVWGVNGSAANGLAANSIAYGGVIYANNTLQLGVDGDMKMIINGSGNVGINTTNPTGKLGIYGSAIGDIPLVITHAWGGSSTALISASNGSSEVFKVDRNGAATFSSSVTATQLIATNQSTPNLYLSSNAGGTAVNFRITSNESSQQVNQVVESNHPLTFWTNSNPRMTITSGGIVCVGGTNTDPAANATNGIALTNDFLISINRNNNFGLDIGRNGTDGAVASFRRGSTQVGTISVTGSATSYNTSSDYRLKQDLKDFSGLDLVSKIKAYDYEWKSDKTRSHGVIAHELQAVINYAVTGQKDGKEMQGVDYSKIVPVLIKAIQELNEKIK